MQYGLDTFDTSLLGEEENGEKIYTLEQIAALLGMKNQKKQKYLSKSHEYDEHDM